MKILGMSYEYPPIGGGGSNVAHPLAVAMTARGHSVDIVTSGMRGLPAYELVDRIDVHRVRCLRKHRHYTTTAELLTYLWPAYSKACKLVKQHTFDVNHTHFALPSGLVSYLLYRKTGLPYVITIHGSDVPGYNPDRFHVAHKLVHPLWRKIVANSAKIISASHFLKDLIQTHIDVPVEIIRNGFDAESSGFLPRKKANRILVVTRMFRRKGVQHFLEALAGVSHDWEVIIAGDGPYLPTLKDQVRRMDLKVNFVGFVQGETLKEIYGTSKIFVFPSLQENFPTVLLEAMQSGCAIITTNADGCGEVIGNAGITVAPERPDQLRTALAGLMVDHEKIAFYSAMARERVKLFRWPRIAARYEHVMQDALVETSSVNLKDTATASTSRRK